MTSPVPFGPPPSKTDRLFQRIAIVGLGLIGGSLALAIRRTWPEALIIAVDRKDVVERGTTMHAIDVGAEDLGMVSEADLIVLAAPARANEQILRKRLPELIAGEAVVTDVAGVKRTVMDAAATLPERLHFVGGHPIAGGAQGGLDHARPDLFQGHHWILCPANGTNTYRLDEFVSGLGAVPRTVDARTHDRLIAFLSHLPQLTASTLMSVIGTELGEDGLELAGPGLKDSTRLASSPADIWKDLAASNADNIGLALDLLIQLLAKLRSDLTAGEVLDEVFTSAQRWKSKLP